MRQEDPELAKKLNQNMKSYQENEMNFEDFQEESKEEKLEKMIIKIVAKHNDQYTLKINEMQG